jgi:O-antigen ligase
MRAILRSYALPDRLDVALFGLAVGLSLLIAAASAGAVPMKAVVGLATLAGAAFLFSLTPRVMFLGWFALAPFLQESASLSAAGHQLSLALYFAPSLVFLVWTLTQRTQWIRPAFLDVLPVGFFLYVMGSVVFSGEFSSVTVKGVYLTVGIGIILYYFFALGPIGSLTRANVVSLLLMLTIVEAVMSVLDGLIKWNLWHDTGWRQPGESQGRAVATLANPAVLGTFLGMGIVLALAVLVWNGPGKLHRLAIATLLIGFPGLYFTLTRGPIIGTVAAGFLVLMTRTKTRLVAVASLLVAIVALSATWSRITTSTVYRQRVTNSGNVQVRFQLEHWSLKLAEDKPLFGWGYNAFDRAKESAGFTAEDFQLNRTSSTSHNSYLTILVNYGGLGLLLLVIPWLVIIWRTIKKIPAQPDLPWFSVGALAALLVYIVANNAGDFRFFSFVPAVPWVLLGFLRRRQLTEV